GFVFAFLVLSGNFVFICTTLIFGFLSLLMLVHKMTWLMLERPMYSLQKIGIGKRGKLLGAMGVALIALAWKKLDWLEKIVDKAF
nr:hypothetical protein [Acidobacteriota bacterium]